MSGFVVDARTLLALRDTLGRLHHQLLALPIVMDAYDGSLGGWGLERELEAFCQRWQLTIREVGGEIAELMRRLTSAAHAYERIERGVAGSGTTVVGPPGPRPRSESGSGTTVVG